MRPVPVWSRRSIRASSPSPSTPVDSATERPRHTAGATGEVGDIGVTSRTLPAASAPSSGRRRVLGVPDGLGDLLPVRGGPGVLPRTTDTLGALWGRAVEATLADGGQPSEGPLQSSRTCPSRTRCGWSPTGTDTVFSPVAKSIAVT